MVTVIKRIGVVSAGKITAIIAAIIGFLYGIALSIFSFVISSLANSIGNLSSIPSGSVPVTIPAGAFSGAGISSLFGLIGIVAIIVLPIAFAILGFIAGAIGAAIYNFTTSKIGGIEVEVAEK